MDDPSLVGLLQGHGELAHQRRDLAWRQPSSPIRLGQRLALDIGHRQVEQAVDLADVVDGAEVGVVELAAVRASSEEPLRASGRRGSEVGDLQGHPASSWVSSAR